MKPAMFWEKKKNNIKCNLCAHRCLISEDKTGICGVRKNVEGRLFSLVYGRVVSMSIDPIEKKPLFHYYPGSQIFSIGTVGCNLRCSWCQNYDTSQFAKEHGRIIGREILPENIVSRGKVANCNMIAYTYNEPTVFYEFAYDISKLAHKEGMKNIWVTNGYMSKEAFEKISPFIDAANIDLKSYSGKTYQKFCGSKLKPILDNIKRFHKKGIWLEITTLIVPKLNDSVTEMRKIAKFIASVDKGIPWHISAFHPAYKMLDKKPTPINILKKGKEIGEEAGLRHVYYGNVPEEENTFCPKCKKLLIRRRHFDVYDNEIKDGKCPCGQKIDGRFE